MKNETKKIKKLINKTSSFKNELSIESKELKWNRRKNEIIEQNSKEMTFRPSITKSKNNIFEEQGNICKTERVHNRLYESFKEQNF